ncbi:MAG TPA: YkgJ family cysteine cluster protein [Terriglobales bacterium]|nr:YkgJ family cysteine cluster protein [Terriglobales bacterium]
MTDELDLRPFRFECTRCGKCCERQFGGVTLYVRDLLRLAEHLGLEPAEVIKRYCTFTEHEVQTRNGVRRVPDLRLRSDATGRCIFLEGTSCSVHPAKPYVCAAAPFVFEIASDPLAKAELIKICDGFGQGPLHSADEMKRWLEREVDEERDNAAAYASGAAAAVGIPHSQAPAAPSNEISNDSSIKAFVSPSSAQRVSLDTHPAGATRDSRPPSVSPPGTTESE